MRTRIQNLFKSVTLLALTAFLVTPAAWSGQVTYDFESFSDAQTLTNQITGVTFAHTMVLSSGGSLNEVEFPPFSGSNVVGDNGGYLTISINPAALGALSITGFQAYFTYGTALTVEAYDQNNALLGSATSAFNENYASSGNAPNELLSISATGIFKLRFLGDPAGGSMVVDDLTLFFDPSGIQTGLPEPGTFGSVFAALAFGLYAGARGRLRK